MLEIIKFITPTAFAQGLKYTPITDIDGLDKISESIYLGHGNSLDLFLVWALKLSISVAAVLAVIYIVIAGLGYVTTDNINTKSGAKDRIQQIILGLILMLSAFLILNTIGGDNATSLTNIKPIAPDLDDECTGITKKAKDVCEVVHPNYTWSWEKGYVVDDTYCNTISSGDYSVCCHIGWEVRPFKIVEVYKTVRAVTYDKCEVDEQNELGYNCLESVLQKTEREEKLAVCAEAKKYGYIPIIGIMPYVNIDKLLNSIDNNVCQQQFRNGTFLISRSEFFEKKCLEKKGSINNKRFHGNLITYCLATTNTPQNEINICDNINETELQLHKCLQKLIDNKTPSDKENFVYNEKKRQCQNNPNSQVESVINLNTDLGINGLGCSESIGGMTEIRELFEAQCKQKENIVEEDVENKLLFCISSHKKSTWCQDKCLQLITTQPSPDLVSRVCSETDRELIFDGIYKTFGVLSTNPFPKDTEGFCGKNSTTENLTTLFKNNCSKFRNGKTKTLKDGTMVCVSKKTGCRTEQKKPKIAKCLTSLINISQREEAFKDMRTKACKDKNNPVLFISALSAKKLDDFYSNPKNYPDCNDVSYKEVKKAFENNCTEIFSSIDYEGYLSCTKKVSTKEECIAQPPEPETEQIAQAVWDEQCALKTSSMTNSDVKQTYFDLANAVTKENASLNTSHNTYNDYFAFGEPDEQTIEKYKLYTKRDPPGKWPVGQPARDCVIGRAKELGITPTNNTPLYHVGFDIDAPDPATEIYSPIKGVVVDTPYTGAVAILEDGTKHLWVFREMNVNVSKGDRVSPEKPIGTAGKNGHVHLEVQRGTKYQNICGALVSPEQVNQYSICPAQAYWEAQKNNPTNPQT